MPPSSPSSRTLLLSVSLTPPHRPVPSRAPLAAERGAAAEALGAPAWGAPGSHRACVPDRPAPAPPCRPPRPAPRPHPGRLRSDTGPRSGFCPGGVRLLPARVTARPDAAANLEIFFSHLFPAFFLCSFCPLCLLFLFFFHFFLFTLCLFFFLFPSFFNLFSCSHLFLLTPPSPQVSCKLGRKESFPWQACVGGLPAPTCPLFPASLSVRVGI